jgi:4-amino-4-deoxy-L-arabinose transferase-like glycosyltransferase
MSATTIPVSAATRPGGGAQSFARRLWRGPLRDPAWARPALFGLLLITGVLYLFNLSRNGYANDFYAAAVQAGTRSWKAFFFGSFDSSSFITVDKTPASLWVDEIAARIFGFSSWTLLVPQALEGIASVAVLYAAVRRWFGPGAGLVAGAVLALTPAAALMFRFNNPDALLVLLMTASAYCMQRAIERDRTRWLVFAGVLLGFGFLTKMAQAFLVLPAFGIAYLWAGPARFRRRVWQVVVLGLSVVAGAGWWVAIAQLWPASSRPYFGGSTNNNILELALGYNGLGRLDGTEAGSIGFNASSAGGAGRFGGGGGGGFGGATGIFRLFGSEFGGQVSWLIPAALISLGALLWVSRRRPRVPVTAGVAGGPASQVTASPVTRMRAFAAIWGGWLLVTGVVFSYMQGIIHPYYMVALAPAIGALVGVGATSLWQARLGIAGRVTAAVAVAVTAWWSFELLARTPDWLPWLRWLVLIAGLAAMAALFAVPVLTRALGGSGMPGAPGAPGPARVSRVRGLAWLPLAFALVAGLAGPLAYSLDTVNHTYTGAIPSAGPTVTGAFGVPGGGQGGFGGFPRGGFGGTGTGTGTGTGAGTGTGTGSTPGGGFGGFPGGGTTGGTGTGTGTGTGSGSGTGGFGRFRGGTGTGNGTGTGTFPGAGGGFGGGLSGNTQVSSALIKLLEQDSSKYKWIAATEGSQEAAPIELATGGDAVMAIGGFNGTDPTPTLAQFEAMVAKGEIHYYLGRGSSSFGGGTGSSAIASWVAAHYTAQTIGGTTVYDLTQPK